MKVSEVEKVDITSVTLNSLDSQSHHETSNKNRIPVHRSSIERR